MAHGKDGILIWLARYGERNVMAHLYPSIPPERGGFQVGRSICGAPEGYATMEPPDDFTRCMRCLLNPRSATHEVCLMGDMKITDENCPSCGDPKGGMVEWGMGCHIREVRK